MPRNNKTKASAAIAGSGGVSPAIDGPTHLSYDREVLPYFEVGCSPDALFGNWSIEDLQLLRNELVQMRSRVDDLLNAVDSDKSGIGRQGVASRTRSTSPIPYSGSFDEDPSQVQRSQSSHPIVSVRYSTTDKDTLKMKRPRSEDQYHEAKRGRNTEPKHGAHRVHSSALSGEPPATDSFWTHMNTYLRPMTEDDLQYVMPVDDEVLNSVLTIPPLGGHNSTGPSSTTPPPGSTPSSSTSTSTSGSTQVPLVGGLTQRLMAAFIPCSTTATIDIDTNSRVQTALPRADYDRMFEEALQKVLVTHSLLDPDIPLNQIDAASEDDEVCAQLRKLFKEYKDIHMRLNTQRRGWCKKAQRCIDEAAVRKPLLEEARQDIEAFKRYAMHHKRK